MSFKSYKFKKFLSVNILETPYVRPLFFYILLTLAVMFPLLQAGYILTTDTVFTPKLPMYKIVDSSYLYRAVISYLSIFITGQVTQKLILSLVLVLMGYGMYRLMIKMASTSTVPSQNLLSYFAGVFYMVNPFVYARFLTGQYQVLLGMAILPFYAKVLLGFYEQPKFKQALKVALLFTIISIVSMHAIGFAILLGLAITAMQFWRHRHENQWITSLTKWVLAITVFVVFASSYWLIPLVTGSSATATTINSFSSGDQQAYATSSDHLGLIGNVAALHGFWADGHNLYLTPQDIFSWWLVPIIALWVIVILGVIYSWRYERDICVVFGLLAILAAILATGNAGTIFAQFNEMLIKYVPFFAGYREPQKFVVLIVFAYAYFGGLGAYWLRSVLDKTRYRQAAYGVFLIPFLCAPLLLWGGAGQLKTSDYPADWYHVNTVLTAIDKNKSEALFLPWHLYMPFSFTHGVIANPAPSFFNVPIISSQDPELGKAQGHYSDPTAAAVDRLMLHNPSHDISFAAQLAALRIGYIVLAKEYDYKKYSYLDTMPGISTYLDTRTLKVYRITERSPV